MASFTLHGQTFPQNYFASPVDSAITLAGNFGELRRNHFHTGIDIKTNGEEGWPIRASADGWIKRISVSGGGYGNVLFIKHPNGYTTTYAHLQRFTDTIEALVRQKQYASQRFEQDFSLKDSLVPVTKGELIGYSGNSGYSAGPHLHFEIHETSTGKPLNPLLFGFDIADTREPVIQAIKIYALHKKSAVRITWANGRKTELVEGESQKIAVRKINDRYKLSGIKNIEATGEVGFSIMTVDYMNETENVMSPHEIELCVDGELILSRRTTVLDFKKKRFINAHVDYAEHIKKQQWFERSYLLPYNELDIYETNKESGIINFTGEETRRLTYYAIDASYNISVLIFDIEHLVGDIPKGKEDKPLKYNKEHKIKEEDFRAEIPKLSLYDDAILNYTVKPSPAGAYTRIHRLGDESIPLHQPITISIRLPALSERLHSKVGIMTEAGYVQGYYKNGWVTAMVLTLGEYYAEIDTVSPSIRPLNIRDGKKMSTASSIEFKIMDKLSGVREFAGYIDGKWALFRYDAKKALAYHVFENDLPAGKHELIFTLTDREGNTEAIRMTFYR